MRMVVVAILFFISNCSGMKLMQIGGSDAEKINRAKMCKERCRDKHYNVRIIRPDGTLEIIKINIVSIEDKTACECKF